VPTPAARLSDIAIENAIATLESGARTFALELDLTSLFAQNGSWDGVQNTVSGLVVVNGEQVTVGPMALDPAYDQEAFDASYACTDDLVAPIPAD
jgi:hypothetical protein